MSAETRSLESELIGSSGAGAFAPDRIPPEIAAGLGPERRRVVRRWLALLGLLGAGSILGVASSLYLANRAPLLLIALSPIGRHLMLVAPTVDPAAFVAIGTLRRLLFYTGSFQVGRALGPAGLVWLEARAARTARFVRWLERLFARASHAVVFLLPGPTLSTIAGASGMRTRVFVPLAAAGTALRMVLILGLAEWLRGPIEALLAWIEAHWLPGTAVLVLGIAIYLVRRSAGRSPSARRAPGLS